MRSLILLALSAVALSACDDHDPVAVPDDNTVVVNESDVKNEVKNDVEKCPRADGHPCR